MQTQRQRMLARSCERLKFWAFSGDTDVMLAQTSADRYQRHQVCTERRRSQTWGLNGEPWDRVCRRCHESLHVFSLELQDWAYGTTCTPSETGDPLSRHSPARPSAISSESLIWQLHAKVLHTHMLSSHGRLSTPPAPSGRLSPQSSPNSDGHACTLLPLCCRWPQTYEMCCRLLMWFLSQESRRCRHGCCTFSVNDSEVPQ